MVGEIKLVIKSRWLKRGYVNRNLLLPKRDYIALAVGGM
jgi:hypothetical protein